MSPLTSLNRFQNRWHPDHSQAGLPASSLGLPRVGGPIEEETHSMNAYPLKPAVCYLAPGTPATETLFGTLIPIGPDPVPVWSTLTSIRAGLVVCETPIGWLHVPTGQGFLLAPFNRVQIIQ